MTTPRRFLTIVALLAVTASGCIISSGGDSSLLVINDSDFDIVELNVAPVGTVTWGPDLLHGQGLLPGESIEVILDCDTYDARFIDETDFECHILDLDLCFDDADWIITNSSCVGATAAGRRTEAPTRTITLDPSEAAPGSI